jgi:hypothetical protein
MRKWVGLLAGAVLFAAPTFADEAARTETVKILESGKLAEGAATLSAMLAKDSANGEARYGLGIVQFMQAVEHLSQGLYRYGLQPPRSMLLPIVRMPVPENTSPEVIDYEKFRGSS